MQYAAMTVLQLVLDQLLPRKDNQIRCQEMLAVALLMETFRAELKGALVLAFIDNDGVRCAVRHGGGGAPEVNAMVGNLWLERVRDQVGLDAARVETHANIADGPSRGDFSMMARLGASDRVAKLPPWARHVWVARPHIEAP